MSNIASINSKQNFQKAEHYREEGERARNGTWGAKQVIYDREDLKMVENIRRKYQALHVFQDKPPENFVSQIAFTQLNTFLLTTDGRLFSWGSVTNCLGRELTSDNLKTV